VRAIDACRAELSAFCDKWLPLLQESKVECALQITLGAPSNVEKTRRLNQSGPVLNTMSSSVKAPSRSASRVPRGFALPTA
jgi:hypothetical protein